jgi:hypothetical protein
VPSRRIILGLVVVNLVLASALLAGPVRAQIFPKAGFFDCCIDETCCQGCCFFVRDCSDDEDCGIN